MNIQTTKFCDVLLIEPKVFGDERGLFFESFNQKLFNKAVGFNIKFVQDNHSKSKKNVLRGLHFQTRPFVQGKLVRCVAGEVFDVAVDIRPESKTFGEWMGVHLSAENKKQLWIPEGFAHGFYSLTDEVEFLYKTTNYYASSNEGCLHWNDQQLKIAWPLLEVSPELSEKDRKGITFGSDEFYDLIKR